MPTATDALVIRRLRKLRITAAVFALLVLALPTLAFQPRVEVNLSPNEASVVINGKVAVSFKAGNGSLGFADRANITAQRLQALVNTSFDPRSVRATGDNWQGRVVAGETLICIATSLDARANWTTPVGLASRWAANIRSLLMMPPIILNPSSLTVPLGETRVFQVGGAAVGEITVVPSDPRVFKVEVNDTSRLVRVTGVQLAVGQIEVIVEGEKAILPIAVRKYAGYVRSVGRAEVTGDRCPSNLVSYAAAQAVRRAVVLEPGARLEVGKIDCPDRPLELGQSCKVSVHVRITGPGLLAYFAPVQVEVGNEARPWEPTVQLFYSNAPEQIKRYQNLFAGKISPGRPSRLLYHHQNAMGKRARLLVEIINPGNVPSSYRVLRAVSEPSIDTVLVGYVAGIGFLKAYRDNISVIEHVPPASRLILVSDVLNHMQTASGIVEISQINGQDSFVRVASIEPEQDNLAVGAIATAPNPLLLQLSDNVYPSPAKTLEAGHVVGQRWAFIPLGKHALDDIASQKKLYGNYGVTYDINVRMENPTNESKTVNVLFEPSAGLASGVFIIDGKIVSTKYAQPPTEYPLASYRLKPGETRTVNIVTVPLAGSNYPANLVVRS